MRTKITRDRSQKKAKPNEVPGKIVQESNFESDEQQQKNNDQDDNDDVQNQNQMKTTTYTGNNCIVSKCACVLH